MPSTYQVQDSDMSRCIESCLTCSRACLEAAHYSLAQQSVSAGSAVLALLYQCADVCQLSVRMMAAESEFHHQSCELCFEVCQRCAEECDRYEQDEFMKKCAKVCRRCGEECRKMAGMTVQIKEGSRESLRM
jgi:hypothetical protein